MTAKTRVGQHRSHQGVPDKFPVKRDRNVKSRNVACPTCKAPIGEPCQKDSGGAMAKGTYHRRRRGLAIQAGF